MLAMYIFKENYIYVISMHTALLATCNDSKCEGNAKTSSEFKNLWENAHPGSHQLQNPMIYTR